MHTFREGLSHVVQMFGQDRHTFVQVFPKLAGLLRALAQLVLSPPVRGGMKERNECIGGRQNDATGETILAERRIVLLRRREKVFPRKEKQDNFRRLGKLIPVGFRAQLIHA